MYLLTCYTLVHTSCYTFTNMHIHALIHQGCTPPIETHTDMHTCKHTWKKTIITFDRQISSHTSVYWHIDWYSLIPQRVDFTAFSASGKGLLTFQVIWWKVRRFDFSSAERNAYGHLASTKFRRAPFLLHIIFCRVSLSWSISFKYSINPLTILIRCCPYPYTQLVVKDCYWVGKQSDLFYRILGVITSINRDAYSTDPYWGKRH